MERKDAIWLLLRITFLYIVYWAAFYYKVIEVGAARWLWMYVDGLILMGILLAVYVLVVLWLLAIRRRVPLWQLALVEVGFLFLLLMVVSVNY